MEGGSTDDQAIALWGLFNVSEMESKGRENTTECHAILPVAHQDCSLDSSGGGIPVVHLGFPLATAFINYPQFGAH